MNYLEAVMKKEELKEKLNQAVKENNVDTASKIQEDYFAILNALGKKSVSLESILLRQFRALLKELMRPDFNVHLENKNKK